ncbi:MAG TPA: hypothetical protein VHP33_00295 [Polyangiaceae bacterium]|nr:hypothetical protein [Polyangiaceae bacterium]
MQSVGFRQTLLAGAAVGALVLACGSTSGRSGAQGGTSSNAGGAPTGSGGTSSNAKAGTTSGGSAASGAAGKATGNAGAAPEVLTEADPDEPCEADPLAASWTETVVELKGGSNQVFKLGAGGPVAILVGFGKDALLARTSTADGPWTEAVALPGSVASDYPERIEVSPDGSTALVLWRRGQQLFFNLLDSNGSFAPAVELDAPQNVAPLALAGQRVLFGYGSNQGIQLIEYTPAGGFVIVVPLVTNFSSMSRDEGDAVAVFATSGLVAEPDKLYPYAFESGFAEPQAITAHAMAPSAWQTFFAAFPNGRAARLTRAWQDPATQGMHLTTRQAGAWGTEERVSRFEGELTDVPALAYVEDRLLLAWKDEDKDAVAVREHDGESWQPEQVLPRSRALQRTEIVGAHSSALLLGEQKLQDEQVSVKKLYRRGTGGTWYCPKLVPNASADLAGDGEGFWFGQRAGAELRIWRFKP